MMKSLYTTAFIFLAACGGGGTGNSPAIDTDGGAAGDGGSGGNGSGSGGGGANTDSGATGTVSETEFNRLLDINQRVTDQVAGAPPAVLPTSGSATYQGILTLGGEFGADSVFLVLGAADVTIDFPTNDVSGSATAFRDADSADWDGTLTLDDAELLRLAGATPVLGGQVVGSLKDRDGSTLSLGNVEIIGNVFETPTDSSTDFIASAIGGDATYQGDTIDIAGTLNLEEQE